VEPEKIVNVPESKQNRENEKFFFFVFYIKEARKKIFFHRALFIKKEKIKNPERWDHAVQDFFVSFLSHTVAPAVSVPSNHTNSKAAPPESDTARRLRPYEALPLMAVPESPPCARARRSAAR
jgi:hypothetical protein